MAGKRQHHIWQMLQRGFSWPENGDNHIWVYSKGQPARRTVTRKHGQQSYFYGEVGSLADKNITDFENEIQGFVNEVRSMPDGAVIDSSKVAPLIAHLEMRSSFVRGEVARLGGAAVEFLDNHLKSDANILKFMTIYLRQNPEVFDGPLNDLNIPLSLQADFKDMILKNCSEFLKPGLPVLSASFREFSELILQRIPEISKEAHLKTLLADFSEVERVHLHSMAEFRVVEDNEGRFILPDTCLAFFMKKGCRPFIDKDSSPEGVIAPISANKSIVGSYSKHFSRDMRTMINALAGCSSETFISPLNNHFLHKVSGRIGRNAEIISQSDLSSVLKFDALLNV